jgi:hypothetical protein
LFKLESSIKSEPGRLLRRALDLMAMIDLGVKIGLDEIPVDEMYAMLIIRDERNRREKEEAEESNGRVHK